MTKKSALRAKTKVRRSITGALFWARLLCFSAALTAVGFVNAIEAAGKPLLVSQSASQPLVADVEESKTSMRPRDARGLPFLLPAPPSDDRGSDIPDAVRLELFRLALLRLFSR